jgi:copper chaperone CopZ
MPTIGFRSGTGARRGLVAMGIALISVGLVIMSSGCSESGAGSTAAAKPQAAIEPVTLTFVVEGMHCGGCAASIQETVAKLEGVSACQVSFEDKTAIVKASDRGASNRIMAAVREMQYQITAKP